MALRIAKKDQLALLAKYGEGVTKELLQEIFTYLDGRLYREDSNGILIEAGHLRSDGYRRLKLFGKLHLVHRLIWCMHTGAMPIAEIDHIDHNKDNNNINNLREVDRLAQMENKALHKNSTTKVCGVSFHKVLNKYRAYIRTPEGIKHLGYSYTLEGAASLRASAETLYGYHKNHGKPANFAVELGLHQPKGNIL